MNLNGLQAPTLNTPGFVNTPQVNTASFLSGAGDAIATGLHRSAVARDKAAKDAAELEANRAIGQAVAGGIQDMSADVFADAQTQELNEKVAQLESSGITVTDEDRQQLREAQTLAGTQEWLRQSGQGSTLATLKLNSRKVDFIKQRPELAGDFLTILDRGTAASTSLLAKNEEAADTRRLEEQANRQKYMVEQVKSVNLWTPNMSNADVARTYDEKVRPHLFEQKMAADRLTELKNDREASEITFGDQFAPNFTINVVNAVRSQMSNVPLTERPAVVRSMIAQATNDVYNLGANAPQASTRLVEQLKGLETMLMSEATGEKEALAARNAVNAITDDARIQMRVDSEKYRMITGLVEDMQTNGINAVLGTGPGSTLLADAATEMLTGAGLATSNTSQITTTAAENAVSAQAGDAMRFPSQDIPKGLSPQATSEILTKNLDTSVMWGIGTAAELGKGAPRSVTEPVAQNIAVYLNDPVIGRDGKMMSRFTERLSDERIVPLFEGSQWSKPAAAKIANYTRGTVASFDKLLSEKYGKPTDQLVTINVDSGMVTVEAMPGSPVTDTEAFKLSQGFTHLLRSFAHVQGSTNYDEAAAALFQ